MQILDPVHLRYHLSVEKRFNQAGSKLCLAIYLHKASPKPTVQAEIGLGLARVQGTKGLGFGLQGFGLRVLGI